MKRIVIKFGGTSVGTIEKIINAAKIVKRRHEEGNEVMVVVSAMSGTTNDLINRSKKISEDLIIKIKNYCKKKSLKFYFF